MVKFLSKFFCKFLLSEFCFISYQSLTFCCFSIPQQAFFVHYPFLCHCLSFTPSTMGLHFPVVFSVAYVMENTVHFASFLSSRLLCLYTCGYGDNIYILMVNYRLSHFCLIEI